MCMFAMESTSKTSIAFESIERETGLGLLNHSHQHKGLYAKPYMHFDIFGLCVCVNELQSNKRMAWIHKKNSIVKP